FVLLLAPVSHSLTPLFERLWDESAFLMKVGDMMKITSYMEVADCSIDDILEEYPDVFDDDSDETISALKMELALFLSSPGNEQEEILAGFPSEHKNLPRMLKELGVITKKMSATATDEEKQLLKKLKVPDIYLIYFLRIRPLTKMFKYNMASYKRRNLSEEDILQEIESKKDRYIRKWQGKITYEDMIATWKEMGVYEKVVEMGIIKEEL
ncbi:hypothetical protein PFISCL1PPCAC_19018, partial [Pristionchus fissidentatus]